MKVYSALLSALAASFIGCAARAHVVANWTEATVKITAQEQRLPGPPDSRIRAQVALAMFEAVNAIDGRYPSYLGVPRAAFPASQELAAARAAYDVLTGHYSGRAPELLVALELERDRVPDPEVRRAAEAAGAAAAAAVLARPAFAADADEPYVPAAVPGRYVGTDLPALPPAARLAKPYFLETPRSVAPPPPPPLTSDRYGRDVEEVRRLGGMHSTERTQAQTAIGTFWARQDVLAPLRDLTLSRRRPLVDDARTYAIVLMAGDDASNAVATAKLDHNVWRPVTAIRNAAIDGNPLAEADAAWEPLLRTPPHPEYPCGHCIVASTFAALVEAEFGEDAKIHIRDLAAARTLKPREMVEEASFSRILTGAHFRFSTEAAEAMGRGIAQRALGKMPSSSRSRAQGRASPGAATSTR